jgi:hypothetical protein
MISTGSAYLSMIRLFPAVKITHLSLGCLMAAVGVQKLPNEKESSAGAINFKNCSLFAFS